MRCRSGTHADAERVVLEHAAGVNARDAAAAGADGVHVNHDDAQRDAEIQLNAG